MKQNVKYLLAALFAAAIALPAQSQNAYVGIQAGYGFGFSKQNMSYFDFKNSSGTSSQYTDEQLYVSFGKGLNFGLNAGYMFNKYLGADLGLSYLHGGETKSKKNYPDKVIDASLSARMLRLSPSIRLTAGLSKVNPYARFGLIIGMGSVWYEEEENDAGDITRIRVKLDGGLAFGLSSAIGATYTVSDKVSLFSELNLVNMSYAPNKAITVEASKNGKDLLPEFTTSEKEKQFVDKLSRDNNTTPPLSEPTQQLKQKLPFGSVGLNVGVVFNF